MDNKEILEVIINNTGLSVKICEKYLKKIIMILKKHFKKYMKK